MGAVVLVSLAGNKDADAEALTSRITLDQRSHASRTPAASAANPPHEHLAPNVPLCSCGGLVWEGFADRGARRAPLCAVAVGVALPFATKVDIQEGQERFRSA